MIKGRTKYFEVSNVIKQSWISKISVNHSNTRQEMQRKNTSETEVLLLVNPLIIKSLGSAYSINDGNQFKQGKSLEFGLESEKPVKTKLRKEK